MYSRILVTKLAKQYGVGFGTATVASSIPTSCATFLVWIFYLL